MYRMFPIQHRVFLLSAILISCLAVPPAFGQPDQSGESVENFIDGWLGAWQAQDINAYFSFYHPDFQPGAFDSTDAWRQSRIRNITRPRRIAISRENIDITGRSEDSVVATFSFVYSSPNYADRTLKELTLEIDGNRVAGILEEKNLAVERLPEQRLSEEEELLPLVTEIGQLLPAEVENPAQTEAPAENIPVAEEIPAEPGEEQPVAAAGTVASRDEWVPPGFENLNQPQVTEIDVYYGGYYLTSVLAEFTDTRVTILDTEGLTAQLGSLKSPEVFQALLNNPLNAHVGLLCYSEFQVNCGTLETDSVEVIFDRSLLRMWLFIAPDLLQDAGEDVIRFLPPSEAGLSFMNQSAAYFTTRDTSLDNYNLFNNTLFAWGENRLSMRSNLVSVEGFDIDTLAFFREFQGRDYHFGLIRENANGFSFMSNERFAGASYGSSLLTRVDLERSLGTGIELYFPTRSRVEIYREGRLISSDYYNVGNNLLDTSDLPNGSYTIEIRIIDAAGQVTTEERFYSKTANIPPADQSLYFLQLGRLENDLDINRLSRTGQNEFLLRGGINKRLGHSLGGSLGFSVVEDTSFLELGLFRQGQNYEFQANAAYENTGASGMDLRLRYRHPKYNLTLNAREVFNGLEDSQIGLNYRQFNGVLEIPIRAGYFSVFHRHVDRPQSGKNLNSGIRFRTRNLEVGEGIWSSNFELSKNDDEVLALLTFSWALQGNNHTSVYSPTIAYANKHSTRNSGLYGSYESNWFRGEPGGNEYQYSVRGDYDDRSTLEARMDADTRLGSADVTGRYNDATNDVEFSGRLSTSIASTGRTSAIGGKRRSESAFLVRVEGDIEAGARFNVLINGSVRGQLGAGETLLIPVSPYNTYDVELQAIGNTLVTMDNRVYRETMYPGNVVNLSWSSQVINIAVGRLMDVRGEPLANAVIRNVVGLAMTDDNGIFQAEINQDTSEFEVLQGSDRCVAAFDNPRSRETVLPLGTLVCR